jgi:uncharacterized protein (TIGR02996 family)
VTEDEAFIRAIVDSPGDDTPRLVYADWLDDRDDPRGPYLRAEHEWARSGKKERALRALAATLDPVWVARVSRPPVGICADKIVMRTNRDPATPADLDAIEQRLKVALPVEFRALLLNWNGAAPSLGTPRPPPDTYALSEIEQFLFVVPIGEKRRSSYDEEGDLLDATELFLNPEWLFRYGRTTNLLQDYLPLAGAGEGDFYTIGVRGKVVGKVAYFSDWTHNAGDPSHLSVVAPSLGALLASIIEDAPEWYRLAKNGDTAGLLAWIDAGGDVNARHGDNLERPLSLAIGAGNLSLVRELLARGAKVDRDIRELAGYASGATGRKIRDAINAAKPTKSTPKKGKK